MNLATVDSIFCKGVNQNIKWLRISSSLNPRKVY